MTEICSIIHKCTIHGEKNYMNLDFSSPLIFGCDNIKSETESVIFKMLYDIIYHITEIKCLSKSVSKEQNRIQGTTDLDKQWCRWGDWFYF